jgi:hypothetical protein
MQDVGMLGWMSRENRRARRAARAEAWTKKLAKERAEIEAGLAKWSEGAEARYADYLAKPPKPQYGWVETRRTHRTKTIFGNRRTETIVSSPSQRNANRRTRQKGNVTITEEWRRID